MPSRTGPAALLVLILAACEGDLPEGFTPPPELATHGDVGPFTEYCREEEAVCIGGAKPESAALAYTNTSPQYFNAGAASPAVLERDGSYWMYFTALSATAQRPPAVTRSIGLARAGTVRGRFTPEKAPVLSPWPEADETGIADPWAVATDGGVTLYFTVEYPASRTAIARTHSPDGITFDGPREIIVEPAAEGPDSEGVSGPAVVVFAGRTLLYYTGHTRGSTVTGYEGERAVRQTVPIAQILGGVLEDGRYRPFTASGGARKVLIPRGRGRRLISVIRGSAVASPPEFDAIQAAAPCPLAATTALGRPLLHLWYHGYGGVESAIDIETSGEPFEITRVHDHSIGFAGSFDGEHWTKGSAYNPVLNTKRPIAALADESETGPAVVASDSTYAMFFTKGELLRWGDPLLQSSTFLPPFYEIPFIALAERRIGGRSP